MASLRAVYASVVVNWAVSECSELLCVLLFRVRECVIFGRSSPWSTDVRCIRKRLMIYHN